jgi:SAM-dependent methyltransferase
VTSEDVRIVTAQAYDQIVDEFVQRNTSINRDLTEFRRDFMNAVGTNGRVIDVGCGPGRDAVYFQNRGARVIGLDASKNMARHARREGVAVVIADMRAMPFGRAALDGVWSAASLLHVPRPDVPATLAAWTSLVRPGGVLGLSTSIGDDEGWEACPYDRAAQHAPVDLRRWFVHHDATRLLTLIEDAGFVTMTSRERVSNRRWLQVLARRAG